MNENKKSKLDIEVKNERIDFCRVYEDPTSKTYNVYLTNCIDEVFNFHCLFETLRKASKDDNVVIHINSPGGYIDTTLQIINSMKECKAEITTIIEGEACSAGSIIFLEGNKRLVREHGLMMCHYYSGGMKGKGNITISKAKFEDEFFKKFFRKIYKGFMTKEEIEKMIEGEDFWFDSKEVEKRLNESSIN